MNGTEIAATLTRDELQAIRLMREEANPDVDFFVCRRDGRIVKLDKTVKYVKDFQADRLPAEGGKAGS